MDNRTKRLESLRSTLERKASDFENVKLKSIEAAKSGMNDLRTLMDFVESNILKEIEETFEVNKFANALERLNENEEEISESEAIKLGNIADEAIPARLGPSKRDFLRGQETIIGLNGWYNKKSLHLPEHIEGKCVGADCVELVWSKVDGAVIYQVEMRHPNEGAFHRAYEGNETSYRLSGLCAGTRVLFRLRSVFGDGRFSEWSEYVEASTTTTISSQYLFTEGKSESEIVVHWDRVEAPGDDEPPTYHVEMRPKNKEGIKFKEVYNGNYNRCTVRGLEAEEEYLFCVKTTCGSRLINQSSIVLGKTKLPIPKKFRARTNNWDEIAITWNPVISKTGIPANYVVEGKGENESEFIEIYDGTRTKIRKTEFQQDTEYSFRIRSKCLNEVSEWSDVVSVRTQNMPVPNNFRVTTESWDTISLSWDAVASSTGEPVSYIVVMKEGNSKKFTEIYRGTETHFMKTDPKQNTEYSFYVRSVCMNYGSEWSDAVKIRTQTIPVPDNFTVKTNTWGTAVLSWKPVVSKSGRQIIYAVEMKSNNVNRFTEIYRGSQNSFTKADLKQDTEYSFRLCSAQGNEVSEWSDVAMIRTQKIFAPNNFITTMVTFDSVTLSWNNVEETSYYQLKVNGKTFPEQIKTNTYTKGGLLPDTEYQFRVSTVIGSEASEWSYVLKVRTQKAPDFSECIWKECPSNVRTGYSVDRYNPRIATKKNDNWNCTIIGNTSLPPNKVVSWNIKILESRINDGRGIYAGVAPSDINQSKDNYENCGWYFDCYESTLSSGPPHNYTSKNYGLTNKHIRIGDTIKVVMNTSYGNLSFVLNEVNYGVVYKGIPLDKPLVPCVVLRYGGDSVELDSVEVKENKADSSIPIPSNITAKSITWDSLVFSWDSVEGASFYQVEFNGKLFYADANSTRIIKKGLVSDTEYNFRVHTVKGNSVSQWSDIVKGRTQKESFEASGWKECAGCIENKRKFSNPKIATSGERFSTITWKTPLLSNKVTSWNIKLLNSKHSNIKEGNEYIGVSPLNINQHKSDNHYTCGWYINTRDFTLVSGPPHNYRNKKYDLDNHDEHVLTVDRVGVIMDTSKGELSFIVERKNIGIAYEGIPLDKPLVPCVIIKGTSVELVI